MKSVLKASPDRQVAALNNIDWDFSDADTGHSGHRVQPYPAKFPPQIPSALVGLLSDPGDLVLDCFGGCGTTAVEALRQGRNAYSVDANPVGTLLTRVKTANLEPEAFQAVTRLISSIGQVDRKKLMRHGANVWRPLIPHVERWYAPHVIDELAALGAITDEWAESSPEPDLAYVALAHVAARMSFQDSETRYKSVPREIALGQATNRYIRELERLCEALNERGELVGNSIVIDGDARDLACYPDANSVGLAITSPPYPNAYDYHLYHRFRIFWLKRDPRELRRVEIGSHLINQTLKDPILQYERDMAAVLSNVFAVLRQGRFAAFVVGSGLHRGQNYETRDAIFNLASTVGFEPVVALERRLPENQRSVTFAGRRLADESIVMLRKPKLKVRERRNPPYPLFPYEEVLAESELTALRRSSASGGLRQAAFSYLTNDDELAATFQALAEFDSGASLRKNSTYASHGLHRYKGKFYPQLAKALINVAVPYGSPGVVLDPFGGSGTVAVESRLAGLRAVSMDINPLAVEVAKAKLDFLDVSVDSLTKAIHSIELHTSGSRSIEWQVFEEDCKEEIESWFPERSLAKLSRLLIAIDEAASEVKDERVRRILRVVTSDLIRDVSHQDPADLRIRRRAIPLEDAPVFEAFSARATKLLERRRQIQFRLDLGPHLGEAEVVHGTSSDACSYEVVDQAGGISCVVSSPPYGVALPYLDTDRLSLATLLGWSREKRSVLEKSLIGSREISKRDKNSWEQMLSESGGGDLPPTTIDFLCKLHKAMLADTSAGFRRQQTPAVLVRYFTAMSKVMEQVTQRLQPDAIVTFVLGDSRTTVSGAQWIIPTVDEVLAISEHAGLKLVNDLPITVTRESLKNSGNAITDNRILILRR